MDADILRLILFLVGVALILGIYFWDRHKKVTTKVHAIRKAQQEGEPEILSQPDEIAEDDPRFEEESEDYEPFYEDEIESDELPNDLESELHQLDEIVHEESESLPDFAEPQAEQAELAFAAVDQTDPYEVRRRGLPTKIIQLVLKSNNGGFANADIWRSAREVELEYGEMKIFHRRAGGKNSPAVFSMASMVEPGTFPDQSNADFITPGLALFSQLPGPKDGLAVFSDMLFTAERLGTLLDASLQDETHSDLTRQSIEHMREEILEYRRQLQLARAKG
ncbi:MAG: cell division protein ZipA C-terminal FtsZ-binding domain-containing protein [Candidatus Sedimenticola sp. 6PFRAG1]